MGMTFQMILKEAMNNNGGKIPFGFIQSMVAAGEVIHLHPTANTRICVIKLTTGHEVVGYSQVLDAKNDEKAIGQKIALDNAIDELWSVFGSIAKVI